MLKHKKWHEVERLYQIQGMAGRNFDTFKTSNFLMSYKAKVKLHGSNLGIQIGMNENQEIEITYQGRNRNLKVRGGEVKEELFGFQEWADSFYTVGLSTYFSNVLKEGKSIVVYGEWCGKGIQTKVACSTVDKFWAIFAIYVIDGKENEYHTKEVYYDPDFISSLMSWENQPKNLYVIPWYDFTSEFSNNENTEILQVNYFRDNDYAEFKKLTEEITLRVEDCDPFMKKEFGIEGIGEGLVFYPVGVKYDYTSNGVTDHINKIIDTTDVGLIKNFMFKAKGIKHEKNPQARKDKPPKEAPMGALKILDENKAECDKILEESYEELFKEMDIVNPQEIPGFLKVVGNKMKDMLEPKLKEKNYTWSNVAKKVNSGAVYFFKEKVGM